MGGRLVLRAEGGAPVHPLGAAIVIPKAMLLMLLVFHCHGQTHADVWECGVYALIQRRSFSKKPPCIKALNHATNGSMCKSGPDGGGSEPMFLAGSKAKQAKQGEGEQTK